MGRKKHVGVWDCPNKGSGCTKFFAHKQSLNNHVKKCVLGKTFSCITCSKTFSRKCYLKDHKCKGQKSSDRHVCTQCGKKFQSPWKLSRHTLIHAKNSSTLNCPKCNKTYKRKKHYDVHVDQCIGRKQGNTSRTKSISPNRQNFAYDDDDDDDDDDEETFVPTFAVLGRRAHMETMELAMDETRDELVVYPLDCHPSSSSSPSASQIPICMPDKYCATTEQSDEHIASTVQPISTPSHTTPHVHKRKRKATSTLLLDDANTSLSHPNTTVAQNTPKRTRRTVSSLLASDSEELSIQPDPVSFSTISTTTDSLSTNYRFRKRKRNSTVSNDDIEPVSKSSRVIPYDSSLDSPDFNQNDLPETPSNSSSSTSLSDATRLPAPSLRDSSASLSHVVMTPNTRQRKSRLVKEQTDLIQSWNLMYKEDIVQVLIKTAKTLNMYRNLENAVNGLSNDNLRNSGGRPLTPFRIRKHIWDYYHANSTPSTLTSRPASLRVSERGKIQMGLDFVDTKVIVSKRNVDFYENNWMMLHKTYLELYLSYISEYPMNRVSKGTFFALRPFFIRFSLIFPHFL